MAFSRIFIYSKQRGFTLVELSIAILVIGLLVGGVMAGNGLIQQAKFKKLYAQITEAKEAATIFSARYKAIPGDIKNAFMLFKGTACASTANNCNGNGDGRIGYNDFSAETYMAWKHLSLSDIYTGQFSGVSGTTLGLDFPATSFKTAGLRWRYTMLNAYDALNLGNSLLLTGRNESLEEGGLSPKDAALLDQKYDDGIPASGQIIGFRGTSSTDNSSCFSGNFSSNNTSYIHTSEVVGCLIAFPLNP